MKRYAQYQEVNLPELKEGEVYIQHVGDGEYSFNVFGAVWTDLVKFFDLLGKDFKCDPTKFKIVHALNYDGSVSNPKDFFIILEISIQDKKWIDRCALLTIEKINPMELPKDM